MRKMALLAALGLIALPSVALAGVSHYSGTTSQNTLRITLHVSGKKLTFFSYIAIFHCSASTRPLKQKTTISPNLKIKHGGFRATVKVAPQDKATISGTFTGHQVSGSFSETYQSGGQSCTSGTVTYKATK
jgi:hypothetical protein